MGASRYVSIVDIVVAGVAAVAIFLPARPLEGVAAAKGDDEARFALAAAEARVRVVPDQGANAEELSRRMIEAGELDYAVEGAAEAARVLRAKPTRWRAQLAVSKAYAELRDVKPARDWAREALAGCREVGPPACPAWEDVRIDLYAAHLQAGIDSGIDPKVDPDGFRHAGEKGLHMVHVGGNAQIQTQPPPLPPPPAGSGSGSAPSTVPPTTP